MTAPAQERIFVSHSHMDNDYCRAFVEVLRTKHGYDVWYDEHNMGYGLIRSTIDREMNASQHFVALFSPDAVASDWVDQEISAAFVLKRRKVLRSILFVTARTCVVPAMLDPYRRIEGPNGVPYPPEEAARRVAQAIAQQRGDPNVPPPPQPSRTPPPAPAAIESSEQALVRELLPAIRASFAEEDWGDVERKSTYLLTHARAAVTLDVYRMRGRALLRLGDAARASEAYDAALALAGDRAERLALHAEQLEALLAQRDWPAVRRCLAEGLRLAPIDTTWLARQRVALEAELAARERANQSADALAIARELTARPDATAAAWLARARLAHAANQTQEARTALEAAERLTGPQDAAVVALRRTVLPTLPRDRFPQRLEQMGFAAHADKGVPYILPPVVPVAAGRFRMGSDPKVDGEAFEREQPQHWVELSAYEIAPTPVTVAEYACFVATFTDTGRKAPSGWQQQLGTLDHPVVRVSWSDAVAYAQWLAQRSGQRWRLPSEAEWEKAARWDAAHDHARIYPWGDRFDAARCNTSEGRRSGTTPVGSYVSGAADGRSPYEVEDMAGNVWEWTASVFESYPYTSNGSREPVQSTQNRVLRGGSWDLDSRDARAAFRHAYLPVSVLGFFYVIVGFRLVRAPLAR